MKRLVVWILATFIWITHAHAVTFPPYYQDDAWTKMGDYLLNLSADQGKQVTYVFKTGGQIGSLKFSGSNLFDLFRTLEAASEGDWTTARNQSVESGLGYFFPLFGQYLALHGAVKTSISAVVTNWSESLYDTKAYRNLVDILNDTVVSRAKRQTPYLPSYSLKEGSQARAQMVEVEERMYQEWMRTNPDFELSQSSNPARIRQLLGNDTANWREVFNHFLIQAVRDQQGYISVTYERVRDDVIREARRKFYEETVAAIKKQEKLAFSISATQDAYGGDPMGKTVHNGDILAFESDMFIPFLYPGETALITWQVYDASKSPVKGLRKETRLKEGDVRQNCRLRFRIDNLPPGTYRTELGRCIKGECQTASVPFAVTPEFEIRQVFFSPDDKGSLKINRDPFSREARFFQVDYSDGGGSATVELTIVNSRGKTVSKSRREFESASKGRITLPVDSKRFKEGETHTAKVTLTTKKGVSVSKKLTFTPRFYGLKIIGPGSVRNKDAATYQFEAPPFLKPPFTLQRTDGMEEISGLSGNRFTFKPSRDGARTLALALVDSEGRKALGFKKVQVSQRQVKPYRMPDSVANNSGRTRQAPSKSVSRSSSPGFSSLSSGRLGAGSSGSRINERHVGIGRNRARHVVAQIKQDLIPACARGAFTKLDQWARDLSREKLADLGSMSSGELRSFTDDVMKQAAEMMVNSLESWQPNQCNVQWMNQLASKGYVTSAQKNAYVRKDEKYYTVFTMIADKGTDFARPVSWEIVDRKPRTGVFDRVPYKYAAGGYAFRKWVVAVGPVSRQKAQMYADKAAQGKISITGNYTPWIPTGGSAGYRNVMEHREYITQSIGVRP
jgi:hypothetical protein